jgi:AGZA family xanthine/uracil permease-like MFS transporter
LITGAVDTPVELAGCAPQYRDADTGLCPPSQKMRSGTMWLGIFLSGILVVILQMYRVKGAIIMGKCRQI